MGLDTESFVWDFLKQAIFFLALAALFFLVISNADPDAFWRTYHAKDVGLLLSTAHAVDGDLTLDYDKALRPYDYKAEPGALSVRNPGAPTWPTRKRFGAAVRSGGVRLEPAELLDPPALHVEKTGPALVLAPQAALAACPPGTLAGLAVTGGSPLIDDRVRSLARPGNPVTTLTVQEGAPGITHDAANARLACLLGTYTGLPVTEGESGLTLAHAARQPGLDTSDDLYRDLALAVEGMG